MSAKYFDLVGTIHGREYSDHGQYVTADDYYHLQLYSEAIARLKLGLEQDLEKLQAENDNLRRAANELRRFAKCEDLHHNKSDGHEYDQPCKVLARIDVALNRSSESNP